MIELNINNNVVPKISGVSGSPGVTILIVMVK